jgi:NAD(P)-dependent dehydrogenase (short-subunit alcohol dehydrogenase family)
MKSRRQLAGRVVLVTGAAGGLGTALCRALAAAGARIAALDVDEDKLNALVTQLPKDTLALRGSIADLAFCERGIAETLAHFGGLDILVNNAGISHRSLLENTDPSVIRRVMDVNFFGAMQLAHAALPHLKAARGAIVNVSSVAGYAPLMGRTCYSASKHALHGFFESLRAEIEEDGVDITMVCPSFIATGIPDTALAGNGGAAPAPRVAAGGESRPADIAGRIVLAIVQRKRLLLPDRTSRLAWWLSKLMPRVYANTMRQRVRSEFEPPSTDSSA